MTHIHQEISVPATPAQLFSFLTTGPLFSEVSGAPATIDDAAGGAFSLFGGMIEGRSVEVVPDQRVVQAWRPKNWEPGVFSLVRFELRADGDKTTVVLDHTGFPEGQDKHLGEGWHANYWTKLTAHFS